MSDRRKGGSQTFLDRFLTKKPKSNETNITASNAQNQIEQVNASTASVQSQSEPKSIVNISKELHTEPYDIANSIGRKLTDEEKYNAFKNLWVPDAKFSFPASTDTNRKFQSKWLSEFPWLAYSKSCDGAFCKYCALFFVQDGVGKGSNVDAKSLVKTKFNRWKNAKKSFRSHENLKYHQISLVDGDNFIGVPDNAIVDISLQLNTLKKSQVELNHKILSSIIQTIILVGRQEIALRGHRDAGAITTTTPLENDGNFRALLRYRISSGDDVLKDHLEKSQRMQYTSPQIQNEIIEICGTLITEKIVSKINNAKGFTILADETTDVAGIEQFSLCAR
ncbi:uncharacterized protein LOC129571914, partial [Sitodiplosis mosellana]|uniref:uncharacterized protein LOC129571914 n=1 Tax=Sitodiplosis mosellana TaxID=263140 RepID=UPI002444E605